MARIKAVDQKVRDKIRESLGESLCVEAGAGTGKTTSLVSRIVNLVSSGRADVDSLVVITFTEKAAAELSARVREALEGALIEKAQEERRLRIEAAVASLHRARIETIHAFAASLLRERPIEAGLDPGFTVMTDIEASLSFDEEYGDWQNDLLDGEHPEIVRALNLGMELRHVREAAEVLNRYRFLLPLGQHEMPEHTDANGLQGWLSTHLTELREIEQACTEEDDLGLVELRELLGFAERVAAERSDGAAERLILFAAPWPKLNKGRKSSWEDPEQCDRMRHLFREFRELLKTTRDGLRTVALLGVIPHVERFVATYAERRREDGTADFDDLLIWARDLVRDRPEVRRYFQRRFDALLIDEFQDTDPIQAEIALLLASGTGDPDEELAEHNWRQLEPVPGRLFVVGDPKQSIYRFRRADIAVYDEIKRNVLASGLCLLVQNFRSTENLIGWVNRVFDELLIEEEGVQPSNVKLEASFAGDGGLGLERPPVVVLQQDATGLSAAEWQRDEALGVARLLREAIGEDAVERWTVRDPGTGDVRAANWRDVAILFPARTQLGAYEEALALAQVPARHAGSRDYFRRQEVRDLISILCAVDDPTDRISLVGALRSLAFGCSDDDLVIHKATGGIWDYRIESAESDADPVMTAYKFLRSWHRARRSLSLAQLVGVIIEESRLVEICLALPDGAQAAVNLLAISDQARGFAAAGGGGLHAFARWLTQSTEQDAVEVDVGVLEETDDVVRLMTMHGAKGLEYPIVILAGLAGKGREWKEAVPDEQAGLLHFGVGTERGGRYESPGYGERWDSEKAAREAEMIRLLYVAATRARDHLVIPHMTNIRDQGNLLSRLEPLLPETAVHREEVDGVWVLDATQLGEVELTAETRSTARKRDIDRAIAQRADQKGQLSELRKEAAEELPYVVASSVERSTRPLAAEASHSADAMLVPEGPPLEIGDALHLVMERVSLPGGDDLTEVVEAVCSEAGLPGHKDEVHEMAARCLESPTVKRAIESETYQREVPFTVPWDEGFATGRADLVFRTGDELVVVDFKTDSVDASRCANHAREHYSGQADVYTRALAIGSRDSVGKTVFVYCRPGTEVALAAD